MSTFFRLSGPDTNVEFYREANACLECNAVLDVRWVGPLDVRPKFDFSSSLDGARIVSARFARFAQEFSGLTFLSIPQTDDYFVLVADARFEVDTTRSRLDRLEYCLHCDAWRGVRLPARLVVPEGSPPAGFSATDICFGFRESRPTVRQPMLVVDGATRTQLERERFSGLTATPLEIGQPPSDEW